MKALHCVTFILLVIGGLNWRITGLWSAWDLGNYITPTGAMIVYILVGLAAIVEVVTHKKNCAVCSGCCATSSAGPSA
ncbi:MAG: DUF378 domain-containing protein [Candidatus Liptonbacteria bacterium]